MITIEIFPIPRFKDSKTEDLNRFSLIVPSYWNKPISNLTIDPNHFCLLHSARRSLVRLYYFLRLLISPQLLPLTAILFFKYELMLLQIFNRPAYEKELTSQKFYDELFSVVSRYKLPFLLIFLE